MVLLWISTTELVTLIYTLFIIRLAQLGNAVEITVDDLQVFLVVDIIVIKIFQARHTAAITLLLIRYSQQSKELGLIVDLLSEADLSARDGRDDLK